MGGVAVVTDSTSYLPDAVLTKYDVRVVPLQVVISGRVGDEGRDVLPDDVARALTMRASVSTSRPTPAEFLEAYSSAAKAGASAVLSVHLSAHLSGTIASARLAAAESPIPVRVVDSGSTAMGLGFPVIAAAEAAAGGAAVDELQRVVTEVASRTTALFYVDTLDYLRRGGRIGAAAALLGSALAMKPLLHVQDGRIAPLEKVRTASKAQARLEELAVAAAGSEPADVAVHHLAAPDRAAAIADRLRAQLPGLHACWVSEVGAVIGAHVGPGLLGVVVSRR